MFAQVKVSCVQFVTARCFQRELQYLIPRITTNATQTTHKTSMN